MELVEFAQRPSKSSFVYKNVRSTNSQDSYQGIPP
jgi:hypothetical protein